MPAKAATLLTPYLPLAGRSDDAGVLKQRTHECGSGSASGTGHGSQLILPRHARLKPDPVALDWHNNNRFRG